MFKKISILTMVAGLVLMAGSCADPDKSPILTFEKLGKGAYVKLLEESGSFLVNLFDVDATAYQYSVEFVDIDQGNTISEYRVEITYADNNPSNGDNSSGPTVWKTFSSGEFDSTPRGFKGKLNIAMNAQDLLGTTGVNADDLLPGDQFRVKGFIVTNDGSTFGGDNSSAAVNGDAFQGHFDFTFNATCPSSLGGSYAYVGSNYFCDGGQEGTVDIIDNGAGKYAFSDWTFGAYNTCYNGFVPAGWGTLQFSDVCNEVSFTGNVDNYGDTWTFDSSVDGAEWTISWENTYGESGTAVITNPGGDWPITIK